MHPKRNGETGGRKPEASDRYTSPYNSYYTTANTLEVVQSLCNAAGALAVFSVICIRANPIIRGYYTVGTNPITTPGRPGEKTLAIGRGKTISFFERFDAGLPRLTAKYKIVPMGGPCAGKPIRSVL